MQKVLVGLSGGVDSAVAALLLQRQGYEVCGVTLRTWDAGAEGESRCCEIDDARKIARALGIRYYALSCTGLFARAVVDPFVDDYLHGLTPNPCVVCNRQVKWEKMRYAARVMGADYVATGHYARVVRLANGRYTVQKALHAAKDQTYMLYRLSQEDLAATLMPLAEYTKADVRKIALEAGLPVAGKPDSQEICFVSDGHYADFIEGYVRAAASPAGAIPPSAALSAPPSDGTALPPSEKKDRAIAGSGSENECASPADAISRRAWRLPPPGCFVDMEGNRLGAHKGITHYTVGQRKGLGIALGRPVYVREIRAARDEVVLADEEALFCRDVLCRDPNFLSIPDMAPGEEIRAWAKIRYRHQAAGATVRMRQDGRVLLHFDAPVRAPAPGQSAVFYDEDGCVIGGGIICEGADTLYLS